MQVKFEFAIYDEESDTFELDEKVYSFELNDEQAQSYEIFQDADLHLYNWFKDSKLFVEWIKKDVYPDLLGRKVVIADINDVTFRGFFFFKLTSGEKHYEYFKKLFEIIHESDWQDREEVGKQILERLKEKRQELIITLEEDLDDAQDENSELNENTTKVDT